MESTTSTLERDVAFWLRAYPRRWRAARGDELSGLVLDLAPPGARRLRWRARLDLVRGGWATRWRGHPPLPTWLLYRLFDRRIPAPYRPWAFDDINGALYAARQGLFGWVVLFNAAIVSLRTDSASTLRWWFGVLCLALLASLILWPEQTRQHSQRKHLSPDPGERLVEGTLVEQAVPRPRATARSALPWVAGLLAVAAATAAVSVALAPKRLTVVSGQWITAAREVESSVNFVVAPVGGRWVVAASILAVALGLGLLGAAVARRRLRRLAPAGVPQPHRDLRAMTRTGRLNVTFWVAVIVTVGGLEISGRLVLGLTVAAGAAALVLLPSALVGVAVCRRAVAADLAVVDVWHIVTRGRVPQVDEPASALRPLPGPVPDGARAPWPDEPPYPALP